MGDLRHDVGTGSRSPSHSAGVYGIGKEHLTTRNLSSGHSLLFANSPQFRGIYFRPSPEKESFVLFCDFWRGSLARVSVNTTIVTNNSFSAWEQTASSSQSSIDNLPAHWRRISPSRNVKLNISQLRGTRMSGNARDGALSAEYYTINSLPNAFGRSAITARVSAMK